METSGSRTIKLARSLGRFPPNILRDIAAVSSVNESSLVGRRCNKMLKSFMMLVERCIEDAYSDWS
jgi:hypothetical protein